jgi:hypothetical protein
MGVLLKGDSMPAQKLDVFVIQPNPSDPKKSFWNRCGVAFVNRDGSINLKLDLFPNVQMQVREPKSDADEGREA